MRKLFDEKYKAIITLPPRNDTDAEILTTWDFHGGILEFDGQEFIFPEGFHADTRARWLEESLLMVTIEIFAEVTVECARCLKPVNVELSGELTYLYYSHGSENVDEFDDYMPVEVDYFGRALDVMPQIQESVYALLPTKVLCRDDCAGICPNCGADLNEGSCSCTNENIDPRLATLQNFIVEQ